MKQKQMPNNDLQTLHRKLKIEQHEPLKTASELRCFGMIVSFCSSSGTRRVTLVTKTVVSTFFSVQFVPIYQSVNILMIISKYEYIQALNQLIVISVIKSHF